MCEDCEQAELLREAYLARRARMAQTWTPRRRWSVDAAAPAAVTPASQPAIEPKLIAAE